MSATVPGVWRIHRGALTLLAVIVGLFAGALSCPAGIGATTDRLEAGVTADATYHHESSSHEPRADRHVDDGPAHEPGHGDHGDHNSAACLIDVRLTDESLRVVSTASSLAAAPTEAPLDSSSGPEPPIPRTF